MTSHSMNGNVSPWSSPCGLGLYQFLYLVLQELTLFDRMIKVTMVFTLFFASTFGGFGLSWVWEGVQHLTPPQGSILGRY